MTIDIFDSFTVDVGQRLDFLDQDGFVLRARDHAGAPLLYNQGSVTVTLTLDDATVYGVRTSPDERGDGAAFHNALDATFAVQARAQTGTAIGASLDFLDNAFDNEGAFGVSGKQGAVGLWSAHALDVANSGSFGVGSRHAAWGVQALGRATVFNSGFITVVADSAHGVDMASGDFTNTRTLRVSARGGDAVAVHIGDPGSPIVNSGLIIAHAPETDGARSYGLVIGQDAAHGAWEFDNSGVLRAAIAIFQEPATAGPDSSAYIDNARAIIGEIVLRGGDDQVRNHSAIGGDIHFGDGQDFYDGHDGRLRGLAAGEAGDDTLIGGAGVDVFSGGDGSDQLSGGKLNDMLSGDGGSDTLAGGHGQDQLVGGGGEDLFVFAGAADSRAGTADLILDLEDGDLIDLSAIDADRPAGGDQAFVLVGAFSRHAGELTLSYDAGTDTSLLEGDTNGDGLAEFQIRIAGDHSAFSGLVL